VVGGKSIRTMVPRRESAGGAAAPARSIAAFKASGTVSATLRWARLTHALCTPETLITLMVTSLVASFLYFDGPQLAIPWWTGLAAAFAGYTMAAVLLLTTLTDPESIRSACAAALEDHFNIRAISDGVLRDQMSQAVAHRARMAAFQARSRKGRTAEPITFAAIDEWLTGMGRLALRLEDLQSEFRLQSESRPMLLQRLNSLAERIDTVSDKRTTYQLRETMAGRRQQLRAIEELESLFERGLLRLEHAVAALGTVHARLATLVMRGEEQKYAAALAQDINGEIQEIELFLTALDRVQDAGRTDV
jgi:hypothetical protein